MRCHVKTIVTITWHATSFVPQKVLNVFSFWRWRRDYAPLFNCGDRPEVNLFNPPSFADFRKDLDGEMKRLCSTGLGVSVKQAEPIIVDEEHQLWKKVLGDHSPQSLVDSMLFLCGFNFALRSGEHGSLQSTEVDYQWGLRSTRERGLLAILHYWRLFDSHIKIKATPSSVPSYLKPYICNICPQKFYGCAGYIDVRLPNMLYITILMHLTQLCGTTFFLLGVSIPLG